MTNLVLVMVNNVCPCESEAMTVDYKEVTYDESEKCSVLLAENYRKRPANCFYRDPKVSVIQIFAMNEMKFMCLSYITVIQIFAMNEMQFMCLSYITVSFLYEYVYISSWYMSAVYIYTIYYPDN